MMDFKQNESSCLGTTSTHCDTTFWTGCRKPEIT